jgi:5-methylcytosine-specific restriction protein B
LAGDAVLAVLDPDDASDEAYAQVQAAMERAAPELSRDGWAHKYWFLIHPDRLDDFHSPRFQRFHLIKLLQMPPDHVGILDGSAPRFICAAALSRRPASLACRSIRSIAFSTSATAPCIATGK